MIITERLYLRECTEQDFDEIAFILQDWETMYAYEHGFTEEEVWNTLIKQIRSYRQNNFGLWAVIHKEQKKIIGLCGITVQNYRDGTVPELGYIFHKNFWHKGYACESALACLDYAFQNLKLPLIYAMIRDSNHASLKLAKRLNMRQTDTIVKHYRQKDMPHHVFVLENPDNPQNSGQQP